LAIGIQIVIIIIKYIYRAPFSQDATNALKNSYTLNNNVFSLFLNAVGVMSVDLSLSGRLFHTRGP